MVLTCTRQNDLAFRELLEFGSHAVAVSALQFTSDGQTLLSGSWDAAVRAWDVTTGQPMRELLGHSGPVRALALSPDARVLASTGFDGTARLWDLGDGEELTAFEVGEKLHAIAFAPTPPAPQPRSTSGRRARTPRR